jgi:hypothetical protein
LYRANGYLRAYSQTIHFPTAYDLTSVSVAGNVPLSLFSPTTMKTAMSREAARFLCRSAFVGRTPIAPRTEACTLNVVQRGRWDQRRGFVATKSLKVVKPYILADIGEGKCRVLKRLIEG